MEEESGVYKIPCKINGLKLKFIFDTGASAVSISSNIADMMLENGYLERDDIMGLGQAQIADGSIVDNAKINLKSIEIGGIVLHNVEAFVVYAQSAPLLLGQSVIQRLGKISISGNRLIIESHNSTADKLYTYEELFEMRDKAADFYYNSQYYSAAELYDILFNIDYFYRDYYDAKYYAYCLRELDRRGDALYILQKYLNLLEGRSTEEKAMWYKEMSYHALNTQKYDLAIQYGENSLRYGEFPLAIYTSVLYSIACAYKEKTLYYNAEMVYENFITRYLNYMNISATDCWDKNYKDPILANAYYGRYLIDRNYEQKWVKIAAAWGNKSAIEHCTEFNISYYSKPYGYNF